MIDKINCDNNISKYRELKMIINAMAWIIATPITIKFFNIKNKWITGLIIAPCITLVFTLILYLILHLYTESNTHMDYTSINFLKFIGFCTVFIFAFIPVNIYLILRK